MGTEPWVGSWRPHRPRGPIAAQYTSPGPKYGLPTNVGFSLHDPSRYRAPAYTFGLKIDLVEKQRSPGPVHMVPPGVTAKGKSRPPAHSIYSRLRDPPGSLGPGPATYHLPPMLGPHTVNKSAAPSYSMLGRSNVGTFYEDLSKTPGPCRYSPVATNVFKERAPCPTILGRTPYPGDSTTKPAPNAYSPNEQRRQPGPTFGIRHSPYMALLIPERGD